MNEVFDYVTHNRKQYEKYPFRMNIDQFRQLQANVKGVKKEVLKKPKMNKTESAYANLLEVLKRNGEIFDYQFEAVRLKLADNTTYTPDFMVVRKMLYYINSELAMEYFKTEFHETKGFLRDDAAVKFKVARRIFPQFTFKMIQYKGGNWTEKYPE